MPVDLRSAVAARRVVGDQVAHSLIPLEQSAHATALQASMFMSLILEAHAQAAIPEEDGMEIVSMLSEASHHAAQSRARIGQAHAAMRRLADKHGIVFAGPPNCPEPDFVKVFTGA